MYVLKDNRSLIRLIWLAAAGILIVAAAFSAYYYWDRYVHRDDQSPMTKSINELEAQVRQEPNEPEPRLALAEFYLRNQRYTDAIDQAQQVLGAYPNSDRAVLVIGVSYAFLNQPQNALSPLEKFAEIHRQGEMASADQALETALYYLGDSYLKLGRPADAIRVLNEAVQINRTDSDAFYLLGKAYYQGGDPAAALKNYQNAINFVPDFSEVYAEMVTCYTALNMPDYVTYAQGMLSFSQKDYTTAKQHLEAAAGGLTDFAPEFLGLGLTYEKMGNLQAAKDSLERSLTLDPHNYVTANAVERIQATLNNQP
jgi:tetratricopeptide (TPR) repeat protein